MREKSNVGWYCSWGWVVAVGVGVGCQTPESPLVCGEGSEARNGLCELIQATCAVGELPVDGACVPMASRCAPGTSYVEGPAGVGECVASLGCGPGTVAAAGVCTPMPLPTATLFEDDTNPVTLSLPTPGAAVGLSGVIDLPTDQDDDGQLDADWDPFVFEAAAGAYLRITVIPVDSSLPAFFIRSRQRDSDGAPLYQRYGFYSFDSTTSRELYLPRAGTYELWISDYNHVTRHALGDGVVPTGGDAFGYLATITNLGAPVPSSASLPTTESGTWRDGTLHFFRLPARNDGEPYAVIHEGRPRAEEDLWSDVLPALLVFDGQGNVTFDEVMYSTNDSLGTLVRPAPGESALVVADYYLLSGPLTDYEIRIETPLPTPCTIGMCAPLSIPAAGTTLVRYDLQAGDLFIAAVGVEPSAEWPAVATIFDTDLGPHGEAVLVPGALTAAMVYADAPRPAYVWLRGYEDRAAEELVIDTRLYATQRMSASVTYDDLTIYEMPLDAFAPFGMQHVELLADRVAFFSNFATESGSWMEPRQTILTPDFRVAGPIIDLDSWNFPDGFVTPPIAYSRDGGHLLHVVDDAYGTPNDGTYSVKVSVYTPTALGSVAPGASTSQLIPGLNANFKFFSLDTVAGQWLDLTVTPTTNTIPELWMMGFGAPAFEFISYVWRPDANSAQLGLIGQNIAPGAGGAVSLRTIAGYTGRNLLLVQEGGLAYTVAVASAAPPAHDTCAAATPLDLDTANIAGSLRGALDDMPEAPCLADFQGPEVFYSFNLGDAQTLTITPSAAFWARYVVLDGCGAEARCVAADEYYSPRRTIFTAPAGPARPYLLVVNGRPDSYLADADGEFSLSLSVSGN